MKRGIVAGGNWVLDRVKFIDTYPAQDTLANILDEDVSNGGAPYNVLVDLANLGAPFPLEAIGLIGKDPNGEYIFQDCRMHGISTDLLTTTEEAPTSYTDVMTVKSTGRRTFFHQRGANALLDPTCFDFSRVEARHFHLGYLLLLDQLDVPDEEFGTMAGRVLAGARQAGLTTSIDLVSEDSQRFADLVLPALRHTDVCFMNEFEAGRTSGVEVMPNGSLDGDALHRAASRLMNAGIGSTLVIHVPDGAHAWTRDGDHFWQGSVRVPQDRIVSAVGAGDAFAAGYLYGLHEGATPAECLRLGVCVAATCICAAGCSTGLRPLAECLALGDQLGYRD